MSADPKLLEDIESAKRAAVAARSDFAATLHELQARLNPREIAANVVEAARDRGEDLAERGVEFARERPGAAAGIAAAALALLARRPILRGVKGLFASAEPRPPEGAIAPPQTFPFPNPAAAPSSAPEQEQPA